MQLAVVTRTTDSTTSFDSEHSRTHRRWARTVLSLYAIVVSIGLVATLVHSSMIGAATPPAMQLQASAQIR